MPTHPTDAKSASGIVIQRLLLLLMAAVLVGCQAPRDSLIHEVRKGLAYRLAHLDQLTPSAEQAANRMVAGGRIWVVGTQPGFASEALGRAGGLMSIEAPGNVAAGDVVLAGYRDTPTEEDCRNLENWKKTGAYIVVFAPAKTDCADATISPFAPATSSSEANSVGNLVSLWAWTGELASACTRLGRMPTFYESYGMPNGRKRGDKYAKQIFHQDMQIAPIAAGELARRYVQTIDRILKELDAKESANLERASRSIAEAPSGKTVFQSVGHIWPAQMENHCVKLNFASVQTVDDVPPAGMSLVLYLGYQLPPQEAIDRAGKGEFRLIYTSVQRGAHDESKGILYINPHWPMPDGCVEVPGYDIPILPASGVVQACIYASIVTPKSSR